MPTEDRTLNERYLRQKRNRHARNAKKCQKATCGNCGGKAPNPWRRGLCPRCYAEGKEAGFEAPLATAKHTYPLPAEPTIWPPGSPEKIAVMEARVKAGFHPHHPDDAKEWPKGMHHKPLFGARQGSAGRPPKRKFGYGVTYDYAAWKPEPAVCRGFDPRAVKLAAAIVEHGPMPLGDVARLAGVPPKKASVIMFRAASKPDDEPWFQRLFTCEAALPKNLWHATRLAAEIVAETHQLPRGEVEDEEWEDSDGD